MSTPSTTIGPPLSWRRQTVQMMLTLLGAGATVLALRFVFEDAFKYLHWDAAHYGRYWPLRGWILLHVVGGLMALVCGPLQLWSGVRGRTGAAHRLRGRLYAISVLMAAAGSLWIALTSPLFPSFGPPLAVLGVAWLTSTGLAVVAIRRGKVPLHEELMIRSYVLTFTFVFFRWWIELPILTHVPGPERFSTMAWLAWTIPLLAAEAMIQVRRVTQS